MRFLLFIRYSSRLLLFFFIDLQLRYQFVGHCHLFGMLPLVFNILLAILSSRIAVCSSTFSPTTFLVGSSIGMVEHSHLRESIEVTEAQSTAQYDQDIRLQVNSEHLASLMQHM